jgi:hypothetical protein
MRAKINRRIAHLTTERCDDNDKISDAECLRTYSKLETEIERFTACLPPQMQSTLAERVKIPRQALMAVAAERVLRGVTTTAAPITSFSTVVPTPRDGAAGKVADETR